MPQIEKKLNTAANTKIDQALAAINFTESTATSRPTQDKSPEKIWGLIFLVGLAALALWYFSKPGSGLADALPADTPFYLSLSLPQENKWFTPLFFWQRGNKPNDIVSRLYPNIDLISWPGVSWQENILPLLSGQLEIAILPGAGGKDSPNNLVARSGLKDRAAWFKLFNLQADYGGEALTRDVSASGAWGALTKNPNKIAWRILGNDLYLSDNADILGQLQAKRPDSLAKQLKSLKARQGLALIYARDKGAIAFDNPYIKALTASSAYPLVISLKQAPGAINFAIYSQKLNPEPVQSTTLASRLYNFDSAFYAQNLAVTQPQWETAWPEDLKNNFWPILKDFYATDKAEVLTAIGASEIFLTFSGADWLLNIANKTPENNHLLAILKKAGAAMFAITHPEAIEQKLGDGTKLVELRVAAAGLAWREESLSYASPAVNMESLRGQGEASGYYVGFVPEIGYILTTALPLFNQYAALNQADRSADIEASGCAAPKNMLMAASLPVARLTNNALWLALAKKVIITLPTADKITGCALLID